MKLMKILIDLVIFVTIAPIAIVCGCLASVFLVFYYWRDLIDWVREKWDFLGRF